MTLQGTVISFPTPPYQNTPINAQFYQPSVFNISAISLGQATTVTTALAHNYVIGQQVRLIIPAIYGSSQLNGVNGYVLSIPSPTQVVVSINSSQNVNAFVNAGSNFQSAQIVAMGDVNYGAINASGPSNVTTLYQEVSSISLLVKIVC